MKNNWIKLTLATLSCVLIMVSCEYEFIEIAEPPPPNPEDTVSFATEVEPIFEITSCTNCHSGSLSLDLTVGNAYNSIKGNNLAVPNDPEASGIYFYPHPVSGTHNQKYSTVDDANIIYTWILQGAEDN